MSREPRRLGVLFDNKAAEAAAQKLVEEYGLVVDPASVVREIGVGLQQRVEILKTLYRGADILILDEPTAVLTPQETDELFAVIRRVVRELGMTVIIITHKLYEVMAISDRVGVMRKGRLIGVENTCDVDEKKLASMMVGRPVLYDRLEKTGEAGAEQIRVSGLTVCDDRGLVAVDGLSLSVRAGEVLGIAAIEGNGQSELLEAITGMRRVERGTVEVCGQNVTGKTAGEIRKVGLSHIPEDRLATGVSRSASVTDNLLMGKQRDKAFSGFAFHQRRSSIERYAEEVYERFDIRGAGIDTAVGSMSGGNMQKVVVAREFSFDSPVLIIAQPTRGVDVGAIEFIHTRIIEKRNAGCAILLCSADLDEVFRLSDRIITMYEGRITGEFHTSGITKEEIGWYSILFAFLIGAGILAVSGFHPLEAYGAMLSGAFDSARHIGDFLEYAMVLCVCGLACVLGARVGIFNVGGEGQLLLGAIFAAQVGVWMDGQPRFLVIVCAALAAMAVGGLYAFLPGVLKVKVKVNEVITTIMLNTIAAYLCQYLAKGPWKNANKNMVAATEQLGAQYWFGNVIPRSNLTSAVFAAAVMAFLVWYVMERTSVGYEMRITGENPRFAFFSGLRTDQIVLLSMVVSGAMCGLVGMFRVYGVEHLYRDSVSKDYYFEALMVAMIAQYKPVTVILLSLFFAVLKIGAQGMELIGIPSQIYLIIQTVIIFCMAAESGITRSLTAAHARRRAKRAAEERLKEELKHG